MQSSESLFRLGIVAELITYTCFLLLPFVLYKLLAPVNRNYAILMVVLAVASVPIGFVNVTFKYSALSLLSGADYLNAFDTGQLQAQVMTLLQLYGNGTLVVQVFWGLWLFPFGYLVYKSGMLPRILGVLLMLGCIGYLIDTGGRLLYADFRETMLATYVTLPASLGEIGTCLWLLIMGAKD